MYTWKFLPNTVNDSMIVNACYKIYCGLCDRILVFVWVAVFVFVFMSLAEHPVLLYSTFLTRI